MRRRVFIFGALAVLLLGAVGGVVLWRLLDDGPDTRLAEAAALAPADTARFGWTDWAAVREELGSSISADSTAEEVEELLDAGFDADLTSASALVQSAATVHEEYGVSPASLDWELFAQGEAGALVLMGLPDDLDLDDLRDRLADIGYQEPAADAGVWVGGVDLLAAFDEIVTPELAHLAIDADRRVLVASDEQRTVERWTDDRRGDDASDGVSDVLEAVGEPLSATVYTGEHACGALSMTQADPTDRARAAQLIEDAGEVSPLAGFSIAALPGGSVRVVMAFETEEQARTDADTRYALAAGPAPGQGGDFADRFDLGEGDVVAEGRVVRMDLEPRSGAFVLSDLSHGPVLFATC